MTPATALPFAAIPVGVLGGYGAFMLFAAARLRPANSGGQRERTALRLMGTGVLVAVLGAAASAIWVVSDAPPERPVHLVPFATGLGLGALVIATGLVRHVDGGRQWRGAALRRWVDGVLIASCAGYTLWSTAVGPRQFDYLGRPATEPVKAYGLAAFAPLLISVGVCVTLIFRGWPRRPYATAAAITSAVAGGGALLVFAGTSPAGYILIAGTAFGVFLFLLAAVARVPRSRSRFGEIPHHATWLGLVPVSFAVAACATRLAIYHDADNTGSVIAVVIGAAFGVRQTLATRDLRQYASEVESREARFRKLAHTDPLTGLGNRRFFWSSLEQQAAAGVRATLICIDLDRFKAINDVWGHDVGDALLVEVARRLRGNLRAGDVAARLGGDEFAVLLMLEPAAAHQAAERLLSVLAAPYELGDRRFVMSASIGLVEYAPTDLDELMRRADSALRFAKLRGKNRVEDYDTAHAGWLRRQTMIEQGLRLALDRDELTLAYQPVVELSNGRAVGAEAVLRWHHPALGAVDPAEFLPVAEDCGIGAEISRWALHEACRQLSRWLLDGHDVWVSVDIAVRQLRRAEFRAQVAEALRIHHVPPGRLIVEIEENDAAREAAEIVKRIGSVREAGALVALDAVGAGLSVLGSLQLVPVDVLKISPTLIREATRDIDAAVPSQRRPSEAAGQGGTHSERSATPVVEAIVRVGASLDLTVIAVGVADDAARRMLVRVGCRLAQGEAFGRPMPAEHLDALLSAQSPESDLVWPQWFGDRDGLHSGPD